MSDIAIRIENLSKAYRIGLKERQHETLLGAMGAFIRAPFRNYRDLRKLSRFDDCQDVGLRDQGTQRARVLESQGPRVPASQPPEDVLWALKDVSFEVKHGEAVGIIGRNGAGKSTLLKILSRITEPTLGRAEIHGRVGCLLEVGTGFHPDLTGRENVYLNGTILGMRRLEIDAKFDEIVEFSGIEKFIDTPVKRYSTGMRIRLGFSVAAHLDPSILIIDEVLAVGDAEFQKRCLGKMQDVVGNGRAVVFVSHNLAAVQNLCQKGILIEQGTLKAEGSSFAVISSYIDSIHIESLTTNYELFSVLKGVDTLDCEDSPKSVFAIGESICVRLRISNRERRAGLYFGIGINDGRSVRVTTLLSKQRAFHLETVAGDSFVKCRVEGLNLSPGRYGLKVTVGTLDENIDVFEASDCFEVIAGDFYRCGALPVPDQGSVLANHSWCYKTLE